MSITALGVVRMDEARLSWRALRPVFLAGAAALSWLAITSPAASADVLPDAAPTAGVPAAGVSAGVETIPAIPQSISASEAAAPVSGDLLPQTQLPAGVLDVFSTVPVVEPPVSSQTLQAVSVPITGLTDETTAVVLEIVPEVLEVAPVLETALQPVTDLAADTAPLPVTLPAAALPAPGLPEPTPLVAAALEPMQVLGGEAAATPPGSTATSADPASSATYASVSAGAMSAPPVPAPRLPNVLSSFSGFPFGGWESVPGAFEQPQPTHPGPMPAHSPNVPNSGATGAGTSAGSYAGIGWLSPFGITFPPSGAVRAGSLSEHAPAPVSFDPGSSPD